MAFYYLTLASFLGLMVCLSSWIIIAPHSSTFPTASLLMVALLPLLIPLRGLLHRKPRTYVWNSFLMLAYFSHGIGELYSAHSFDFYPFLTILLSSVCFISSLLFVRFGPKVSVTSHNK